MVDLDKRRVRRFALAALLAFGGVVPACDIETGTTRHARSGSFALDDFCTPSASCPTSGDAKRTSGLTAGTIGYHLGASSGAVRVPIDPVLASAGSASGDMGGGGGGYYENATKVRVLVRATRDSAELTAKLCRPSCQLRGRTREIGTSYEWVTVDAGDDGTAFKPGTLLELSGANLDIADVRLVETSTYVPGCGCNGAVGDSTGGASSVGGNGLGGYAESTSSTGVGGAGGVGGGGGAGGAGGSGGAGGAGGSGGAGAGPPDPNTTGPYAYAETDATLHVSATGDSEALHVAYPTSGPTDGPYPVVVFGHGLLLDPSQYYGYLRRLASFGYIAVTADYPLQIGTENDVDAAKDMVAVLDWVPSHAPFGAKADVMHAGASGHAVGGKIALLAATTEPRFTASLTLDTFGATISCNATDCPSVAPKLAHLHIPTGFLGETVDGSSVFEACAPAGSNFETFYAKANSPSFALDVIGADDASFLEQRASCGTPCAPCNPASVSDAKVNDLTKAYLVAFYERYLRGDTDYDAYLTGAHAKARYVTPGLATLKSK